MDYFTSFENFKMVGKLIIKFIVCLLIYGC
jgi:hypothetical protein